MQSEKNELRWYNLETQRICQKEILIKTTIRICPTTKYEQGLTIGDF